MCIRPTLCFSPLSDAVADRTAELMGEGNPAAEVVPLRAAR
jgi:hypothetical protein